ncbi:hypothetical protein EES40_24595 [Streptomyces sp. ADI93-02]|nr:hypothetical protein EES40_24595 [Streptomyces sp. ADI93-02]
MLGGDLLVLQRGQAAQLHLQDRVRLDLVDLQQAHQALTRDLHGVAAADERDDLFDRVQRLEQAAQDVRPLLGLAQPELRAPDDDLDLVRHPVPDERVDRQRARHPVDERQHVRAEVRLQIGVLVQVVEHDLGDRVTLEHDDEALARTRGRLVPDVRDAADLAVLHQVGDLLREVVGVGLVRELRDDQALTALDLLDRDDRAHRDGAAPGAVRLLDALTAHDQGAGREVRALDPLDEGVQELLVRGLRVLQVPLGAGGDLTQVVRRDVGRHTDRDARGTVHQEVREARRQDRRLLVAAVVVVLEVDGLLVDVPDHLHGQRHHLALGVPHGCGRVVARGTEVAVGVHQRHAHRPVLRQSHERVVDRGVAVRVVRTHDVTDDAGALVEALLGPVATVVHRVQHPAVDGLQTVPHVGQRTRHDDGHRVVEVGALHLRLEPDGLDTHTHARDGGLLFGHHRGVLVGHCWSKSFRAAACLYGRLRCRGSGRPWRCAG